MELAELALCYGISIRHKRDAFKHGSLVAETTWFERRHISADVKSDVENIKDRL